MASPRPEQVDLGQVKDVVPIGRRTAHAVEGGMMAQGLCVAQFGPECDQVVVANAAITVSIDQ